MKSVIWPCAASGESGEEFTLVAGPDGATLRVLIVPALFEEATRTRRMLVETMRALAAAGVASVLPDLPGCNESLAPLDHQSLASWHEAILAAAAHFSPTHVFGLRGGALLVPDSLPGWRFEPIGGSQALRPMLRARTVAAREEGRAETMDDLLAEGRERGIELAGYRLGAAMIRDLEAAALADTGHSTLSLEDVGGAALWLRSEPGEDGNLSAALAVRIVADASQ